eukprot:TRINITY_DN14024_c0_g1_i1.p2 TRINITY_DN14024_c0_g1~~TRINITY_DN14024_c0_g1_i1.p2  ORF type:complete len:100 (+),score=23.09 TRINITY_DN14024_c0_g1_i1:207-506(+)
MYPAAANHTDPTVRVIPILSAKTGTKRPAVLLWQQHGKKKATLGQRRIERRYYKCYVAGCKARLKLQVDEQTGEQLDVSPSGMHNHAVELTWSRYLCPT